MTLSNNDTQHSDNQHNDTRHKNKKNATLGLMTLSLMTLSIMTLSILTLSIMTPSITTFSIMTFSIMTLSMKLEFCIWMLFIPSVLYAECHKLAPDAVIMLSVVMLSVVAPFSIMKNWLIMSNSLAYHGKPFITAVNSFYCVPKVFSNKNGNFMLQKQVYNKH